MFRDLVNPDAITTQVNKPRLQRSYENSVFWSRLMLAGFFTITILTLLWAIPWLSLGMQSSDYNSRVILEAILALGAAGFAYVAVRLRDRKRRAEATFMTWSTVYDKLSDLRRREYFYDRLVMETERARRASAGFAVVVLRLAPPEGAPPDLARIHNALSALEPMVNEYDWLAAIGAHEVAMFVPQLEERDAPAFADRLRRLVEEALSEELGLRVHAGWSLYGGGVRDAGELVANARRMLPRIMPMEAAAVA